MRERPRVRGLQDFSDLAEDLCDLEGGEPSAALKQLIERLAIKCSGIADVFGFGQVPDGRRYRVMELTGPTRLVVDIQH